MKLRLLDLFSGIGGFSLGLERTGGFQTVAFCEISPSCRHLLAHHWPEIPCYDDITTLTAERLAADGITVDAICGGFPCQDLSFAGKGAGLAGARSGLWRDYARLIGELRPRVVLVENVSALLGRGLGDVLGDLAALGYDAWWDCIPASAVGAPHRRDRLWLIAYPRSEQHEGHGLALRRSIAAELSAPDAESAGDGRHGERLVEVAGIVGSELADATGERQPEARGLRRDEPPQRPAGGGQALADPEHGGRQRWDAHGRWPGATLSHRWWLSEPDVGRVANAVPARVDRLHGLGNAVVPEIPFRLGRAILAAEAA